MQRVTDRIWEDLFMPTRVGELQHTINLLVNAGYSFLTTADTIEAIQSNIALPDRFCMFRIDVDGNPKFCLEVSKILYDLNLQASFYFRLCTSDTSVMRAVLEQGHEVGYHFEEIASFAKKHKLKSQAEIQSRMPEIRMQFEKNFMHMCSLLGGAIVTVASHGDFANRKLGMTNSILIDDTLRQKLNIKAETYDSVLIEAMDDIVTDLGPDQFWRPSPPADLIPTDLSVPHAIRVLVHPKHWKRNVYWNIKQNVQRVAEGLAYR